MQNQNLGPLLAEQRTFMKSAHYGDNNTDQKRMQPQPPLCKQAGAGATVHLPENIEETVLQNQYTQLLRQRRSRRVYNPEEPITLQQLAFILWSCQGIEEVIGKVKKATLRPVPSGGARHAFETYITVRNVKGLSQGLYHYLPLENKLEFIRELPEYEAQVTAAMSGQAFAAQAAALLIWSCVPYRSEWRYGLAAQRLMLMDIGHVGQNAYLSAEALGLGTCCMAAFDQAECDALLGIDGEEEFSLYAAPIGKERE